MGAENRRKTNSVWYTPFSSTAVEHTRGGALRVGRTGRGCSLFAFVASCFVRLHSWPTPCKCSTASQRSRLSQGINEVVGSQHHCCCIAVSPFLTHGSRVLAFRVYAHVFARRLFVFRFRFRFVSSIFFFSPRHPGEHREKRDNNQCRQPSRKRWRPQQPGASSRVSSSIASHRITSRRSHHQTGKRLQCFSLLLRIPFVAFSDELGVTSQHFRVFE